VLAPFGYDCLELEAHFTPDGKRVFYSSKRPMPGENSISNRPNIWYVDKTDNNWSEPKFLGPPLNDYRPVYFSFENNGILYFTRSWPREICSAKMVNGQFTEITRQPDEINSVRDVAHPAVAPDGSYIIVDSCYEEDNHIVGSLYISFRKPDGAWTKAVSMHKALNADDSDIYAAPRVTPDGKYIFFESYFPETDKSDIYWVSAEIVEELKPDELKRNR
jgi:Tol biopolymer transport system component